MKFNFLFCLFDPEIHSRNMTQTTITGVYQNLSRRPPTYEEALKYTMWYIVDGVLPISHVDTDHYRAYVNGMTPGTIR